MAHSATFDTLAYAKKMKAAGFTEQQAEGQAAALAEVIDERMATKQDLQNLEERLILRLTIRTGSMLAATIAILATLIKLL